MTTRTLPFRVVTIDIANGSDPIPREFDVGDAVAAVGADLDFDDFGDIIELCGNPDNPTGQCVYGGPHDRECRYCQRPSGLDE